jgi:DNA repair exonuclease SbcCD nuclease subunit
MKFLITADFHFHHFKEFDRLLEDGTSLRLDLYKKTFKYLSEYCKENNIKHWFDLGDIFHSRESISVDVLDVLGECLGYMRSAGVEMHFVTGNHDQGNKSCDVATNKILSAFGKIYSEDSVVKIQDVNFLIYPWKNEPANFNNHEKLSGKTVLLGHKSIKGSMYLGNQLDGDVFDAQTFDWAFFGHIHQAQSISDKAFYVGSTMANNFGERDSHHGFVVYDSDSNVPEFRANPWTPTFVQHELSLKDFEIFCKIPQEPTTFAEVKVKLDSNDAFITPENLVNIRVTPIYPEQCESRLSEQDVLSPENLVKKLAEIDKISPEVKSIGLKILETVKNAG